MSQIQITDSWGGTSRLDDTPDMVAAHATAMFGEPYREQILSWYAAGAEKRLELWHGEVPGLVEFWERVT